MKFGRKDKKERVPGQAGYAARLGAFALKRPQLPPVPPAPPEGRKYTLFQELTALRQEIQDAFSSCQLELADMKGRIDPDVKPGPSLPPPRAPEPAAPAQTAPAAPEQAQVPAPDPEYSDENGPEPAARSTLVPVAAAVLLLAVAAVFSVYRHYTGALWAAFPLPGAHAVGLCADPSGGALYFADPERQLLFSVSNDRGQVLWVKGFPAAGLRSLAFDGSGFWSSDGKALYRHEAAAGYEAVKKYQTDGSADFLCWDGAALYGLSSEGAFTVFSGGRSAEIGRLGLRPAAVSCGEGRLWLLGQDGRLREYDLSGGSPAPLRHADIARYMPEGLTDGLTVQGEALWLSGGRPPELRKVEISKLKFSEK